MRTFVTRTSVLMAALLAFTFTGPSPAAAQEVGDELTLTGCLAHEMEEGEAPEYYLAHVQEKVSGESVKKVELLFGEDANPAPHVGHTVKVTGTVASGHDEEKHEHMEKGEHEGMDDHDEGREKEKDEKRYEKKDHAKEHGMKEMGRKEKDELHLRVSQLQHVSATCQKQEG